MLRKRSNRIVAAAFGLVAIAWVFMLGSATLAGAEQRRAQSRAPTMQVMPVAATMSTGDSCECHWCATYGSENPCACGSSGACFKFIGWTRSATCEQRQGECKAHGTMD